MNTKKLLNKESKSQALVRPRSSFLPLICDPIKVEANAKEIRKSLKQRRGWWREWYSLEFPNSVGESLTLRERNHLAELRESLPEGQDAQEEYVAGHLKRHWMLIKAGKDLYARELNLALRELLASGTDCGESFTYRAMLFCEGMLRDIGSPIGTQTAIWHSQYILDRWSEQKEPLDYIFALMTLAEQHRVLSEEKWDEDFRQALYLMQDVCTLVMRELTKHRRRSAATRKRLKLILFVALRWKFRLITKHAGQYYDPVAMESLQYLRELELELEEPYITLELTGEEVGYYLRTGDLEAAQNSALVLEKCEKKLHTLSPYTQFFVLRSKIELLHKLGEDEQAVEMAGRYAALLQEFPIYYDGVKLEEWRENWLEKHASNVPALNNRTRQRPPFTTGLVPLFYSNLGLEFLRF